MRVCNVSQHTLVNQLPLQRLHCYYGILELQCGPSPSLSPLTLPLHTTRLTVLHSFLTCLLPRHVVIYVILLPVRCAFYLQGSPVVASALQVLEVSYLWARVCRASPDVLDTLASVGVHSLVRATTTATATERAPAVVCPALCVMHLVRLLDARSVPVGVPALVAAVDALLAADRLAEAVALWHRAAAQEHPQGVTGLWAASRCSALAAALDRLGARDRGGSAGSKLAYAASGLLAEARAWGFTT